MSPEQVTQPKDYLAIFQQRVNKLQPYQGYFDGLDPNIRFGSKEYGFNACYILPAVVYPFLANKPCSKYKASRFELLVADKECSGYSFADHAQIVKAFCLETINGIHGLLIGDEEKNFYLILNIQPVWDSSTTSFVEERTLYAKVAQTLTKMGQRYSLKAIFAMDPDYKDPQGGEKLYYKASPDINMVMAIDSHAQEILQQQAWINFCSWIVEKHQLNNTEFLHLICCIPQEALNRISELEETNL